MRRILATSVCLALLWGACGDDEPMVETTLSDRGTVLDDVDVSGEDGEQPTLEFDMPLEVDETVRLVLSEGDGDTVAEGVLVTFDFLFVNGRDGSVIGSSYEGDAATLVFEDTLMAGVFQGLDGVKAGSRVLVAIAPGDGGGADPTTGLTEEDTVLFFAEVLDARETLERAEGEPVDPPAGLPTVELGEDGAPTITVPGGEPPAELVVQPLIEGTGAAVEAGQTITVHYTGVLWEGGTQFDSSWERGSPTSFEIGTGSVIPGWDEGLVGQAIGSQILLVVPPAKGYGDEGSGDSIPPGATIVFVVDILDAR